MWEAMENFRTLGALTTPKEIVPIPILPREGILEKKDGMHQGRGTKGEALSRTVGALALPCLAALALRPLEVMSE